MTQRVDERLGSSMEMEFMPLQAEDEALVEAARDVLRRNYLVDRHEVGAAVRCASGRVYCGVNIEACAYGPCAETIALGTAFSQGEREITDMVAVCRDGDAYPVLSPCGNCRQMLIDYAPEAMVILAIDGHVVKAKVADLLPGAALVFDLAYEGVGACR
jgi:cytidine deaminase